MIFYRERLYAATSQRLLKLHLSESQLVIEAQKELPVRAMFALKKRLLLWLPNRSLKEVDVDHFEPAGKSHMEKYRSVCASGISAYFITEAGAVVSDSDARFPELTSDTVDCMHCADDGSLFAAIGNDVFALANGASKWRRFINPARASASGHWTFSSISGWHAELPLLAIAAHSKAPELVVFGLKSGDIVQLTLMTEDALPQYPLSSIDPDADCCPVGMALDFTDSTRLQPADPNDPPLPPLPLLWTLTTDGTLVPFRVVRRGRAESHMLALMRPIEGKGAFLETHAATAADSGDKSRPKLQVTEEIPLDASKQQPDIPMPVTVDLGGFKNLLAADFVKIHGLLEDDLQRLAEVNAENEDLAKQIEEEAARLLHTKNLSEPSRFIEDDHRVAEELSAVGENQMEQMLVLIKASNQKHQRLRRLQHTIRESPIAALEEQIESMHISDLRRVKPLSASASIDEVMEKIRQLDIAADQLASAFSAPKSSPLFTPAGDDAKESRERMKAALASRPARLTRVKEAPKPARPLPPASHAPPLPVMHGVMAERNKAALREERLPVVESSATPDAKDSAIFRVIESVSPVGPSERRPGGDLAPKADTPTAAASSLASTDTSKLPLFEKAALSANLAASTASLASEPSPLVAAEPESALKFPKAFQLSFGSSSTEEAGSTAGLGSDKGKSPLSPSEGSEKSKASQIAGLAALLAKAPSSATAASPVAAASEATESTKSPPKSPLFSARSIAFGKPVEQPGDGSRQAGGVTFNFGFTTTAAEVSSPFRSPASEKEDASASTEPEKIAKAEAPTSVKEKQPAGVQEDEAGSAIEREAVETEQEPGLQAEAEQLLAPAAPTKQEILQSPSSQEEEQPLDVSSEALQQMPGNEEPEADSAVTVKDAVREENDKASTMPAEEAPPSEHTKDALETAKVLPSVDLEEQAREDRQAIEVLASAALTGLDTHQAESLSVADAALSAIGDEPAASNVSMEPASTLQSASIAPSELSFSLGRSLADIERQGEVRTLFGVSAPVVEAKHSSALPATPSFFAPSSSPLLQQQATAGTSPPSFGQHAFGQAGQATFARPAFGQSSFAPQQPQQFGQSSFGQPSQFGQSFFGQASQFGQSSFGNLQQQQSPFSVQPPGQSSGFSTYASKGTTFFGTPSSQPTQSAEQRSPKKDEQPLPPSFSGFRE